MQECSTISAKPGAELSYNLTGNCKLLTQMIYQEKLSDGVAYIKTKIKNYLPRKWIFFIFLTF